MAAVANKNLSKNLAPRQSPDSGDEVDGYVSDDAGPSLRLPDTHVKDNAEVLQRGSQRVSTDNRPSLEIGNPTSKSTKPATQDKSRSEPIGHSLYAPKNLKASEVKAPSEGRAQIPNGKENVSKISNDLKQVTQNSAHKPIHAEPSSQSEVHSVHYHQSSSEVPSVNYHQMVSEKLEVPRAGAARLGSPYSPKKRSIFEEKRSGSLQEFHASKMIEYGKLIKDKELALKEYYDKVELKDCTFAPKINDRESTRRRNLDEFLDHQKKFIEKIENKRKSVKDEQFKAELAKEGTHKPEICEGTKQILQRKSQERPYTSNERAYERLYKIGINSHAKHLQNFAEQGVDTTARNSSDFIGPVKTKRLSEDATFKPQILPRSQNLKRDEKIDNLLYKDAMVRQQKSIEASYYHQKAKSDAVKVSSQTNKSMATRFVREFDTIIQEYLEEGKPYLDYIRLNEFLRSLRFLKESENVQSPCFTPERVLLADLWYILKAEHYGGVHRRNLLVFLLAVLGLHFQITKISGSEQMSEYEGEWPKKKAADNKYDPKKSQGVPALVEYTNKDRKTYGHFDGDGNFELNQNEVKKIHNAFEIWYLNRLTSSDNLGAIISARYHDDPTHEPEILEKSKNLAQNYREGLLGKVAKLMEDSKVPAPKDGKLTHVELLILSKDVVHEKVSLAAEQHKHKEIEECTFTPHVNEYQADGEHVGENDKHSPPPYVSLGENRVFELYARAKPRIEKTEKHTLDVEYEKSCDECTFHPNISSTKHNQVHLKDPSQYYAKMVDHTIDRLKQARQSQNDVQHQLARGFPNGHEEPLVHSVNKEVYKKMASIDYVTKSKPNSKPVSSRVSVSKPTGSQRASQGGYDQLRVPPQYEEAKKPEPAREYQLPVPQPKANAPPIKKSDPIERFNKIEPKEPKNQILKNDHKDEDDEDDEHEHEEEKVPLLFVDVNLGQGKAERIVVYDGDRSDELARDFADKHGLGAEMTLRLKDMLDAQIANVLTKIEEEDGKSGEEEEDEEHQ